MYAPPAACLPRESKYADVPKRHEYTEDELAEIDAQVLNETPRGAQPRYWEDTEIGEELPTVVRGPLSLQDVSAFLVGTGRSSAHGVLLREALRHPDHFFRNPESGGGLEYTGIGHLRDSVAEAVGVPGAYDYGPQRVSWLGTLMTNWMGDDAFLKRLRVRNPSLQCLRRHPVLQGPRRTKVYSRGQCVGGRGHLDRKPAWGDHRARHGHGVAPFQGAAKPVVHGWQSALAA